MSFETSGADYLRRLKQDENQQSRAYIEPAPAPAPADTEQAQPERRRNPRYKCEGSAAFRVRGSTVRTWGTFTDLSVSGCYVELKATFPVGAAIDPQPEIHPLSMPIILNPGAALQALADFFEGHTPLSKDEFLRLRKSQG